MPTAACMSATACVTEGEVAVTLSPKDRMELNDFVTGSGRWIHRRAETADREVLVLLARVVLSLDRRVDDIEQRLDRIEVRFKATETAS